jgi:hypothetical protein
MIRNELSREVKLKGYEKAGTAGLDKLEMGSFGPTVANQVREIIGKLKNIYLANFKNATAQKEKVVNNFNKDSVSRAKYLQEKDDYENESLHDLVTNRNTPYRILDLNGEYIQKIDPVYLDPTGSDLGRAHFFAPKKKVFGNYYDTYWVNLIVIWMMSFVLGITLYFDVLKKFINLLENIFSRIGRKKSR